MSAKSTIYTVTTTDGQKRLVRATGRAPAERFVAKKLIASVEVAQQDELIDAGRTNQTIHDATEQANQTEGN